MSKNLLKLAYNDDFSYDYEELKSYKKPRKTIPKENFEETKRKAIQKAVSEGYDQVIFRSKNKKLHIVRTTQKISSDRIIGYIRLCYKDNELIPKFITA